MKLNIVYTNESDITLKISKDNKHLNEIIKFIDNLKDCNLLFYKNSKEVYIDIYDILFFETDLNRISAHTKNDVYFVKEKLYELEKLLPNSFIRVSKSTIVNKKHIYSINKNVTQPGIITFNNTYKKTSVSRMYFKKLKEELK